MAQRQLYSTSVNRPTKENSLSFGSVYECRREYVLRNPPKIMCGVAGCHKRLYDRYYTQYATMLRANIATVQAALKPEYYAIQRRLARALSAGAYKEFGKYLGQLIAYIQQTQGLLSGLSGPGAPQVAAQLAAQLAGFVASIPPVEHTQGLLQSTEPISQIQYSFYTELRVLVEPLGLPGVGGDTAIPQLERIVAGQAVNPASLTTLTQSLQAIHEYLMTQNAAVSALSPDPRERPYTRYRAEEDVLNLKLRGKEMVGELNNISFNELGLEHEDCRLNVANVAAMGTYSDADVDGPIDVETAYDPAKWGSLTYQELA